MAGTRETFRGEILPREVRNARRRFGRPGRFFARFSCVEQLEPRHLLAFGQPDLNFGTDGRATFAVSPISPTPGVQQLDVVGDRIIASGLSGLARWSLDGDIDGVFGEFGTLPGEIASFRDAAAAPDGTIYTLTTGAAGTIVFSFDDDGKINSSFGSDGTALVSRSAGFAPASIAVQPDGKVLVAGTVKTDGGDGAKTRIYRINEDGTSDMSFGAGATVELLLGAGTETTPIVRDTVVGLDVTPGGKIVLGGSSLAWSPEFFDDENGIFRPEVLGDSVFAVAQFNDDGSPDGSFGAGAGVARVTFASGVRPGPATAFARKGDDSVALAGFTDRLAYAQFDSAGGVAFNRATDEGAFGRPLDMAAKPDGRLFLVGRAERFSGQGLQLTYIEPGGDLGNVVQTNDANNDTLDLHEDAAAAIAIAPDGDLLVGGLSSAFDFFEVVKFKDGSLGDPRPDEFVDARGNDIVRDANGGLHVAFFDAGLHVLKYAYRAPNGLWKDTVVVDGEPESGHYLSIAVDADARPGIAYFDGLHGDLKYAYSPADSTWTTQVVDSAGSVGLYPSLKFDGAKRATIAYYKKTGGDLKLAALLEGGEWAYDAIDTENDVGRAAALVAQPSGRWSIAYVDTTSSSVKLAHRTKNRVWQIDVAATTTGGADFLSLAYNPFTEPAGVFQQPAISYYDADPADLKIAQFNEGAGWSSTVLATHGASGLYSTLTFDALVGPTVYYYHRNFDRVVRATNSVYDGLDAEAIIDGGGRLLSVFSDGNTLDAVYLDRDENVLKVRTLPLRV